MFRGENNSIFNGQDIRAPMILVLVVRNFHNALII